MTRNELPSAPTRTFSARQSASRLPVGGERGHRDRRAGRQAAPVAVVDVHHPGLGVLGGEQRGLGREVVLHVGVEVQVVLGQVGEDGHVVAGTRHPAQGQRVAGHLHGRGGDSALGHRGQQRLQVSGLGGGELAGQQVRADPGLHPADQAGHVAGHPQPGLDQVGGGGLAAGAGHADQPQPLGRVTVDPAGDLAEPGPGVVDHEHRHSGGGGPLPPVRVGKDGHRTRAHGGGGEFGPVHPAAGQRRVQIAGPHRPGVVGDAGHRSRIIRRKRNVTSIGGQSDAEQQPQTGKWAGVRVGGTHGHGHAERLPPIRAR